VLDKDVTPKTGTISQDLRELNDQMQALVEKMEFYLANDYWRSPRTECAAAESGQLHN